MKPTTCLDHEALHEDYNNLMKCVYPYLDTDQQFAEAILTAADEPNIATRIELVEKICDDWSVPYERRAA